MNQINSLIGVYARAIRYCESHDIHQNRKYLISHRLQNGICFYAQNSPNRKYLPLRAVIISVLQYNSLVDHDGTPRGWYLAKTLKYCTKNREIISSLKKRHKFLIKAKDNGIY